MAFILPLVVVGSSVSGFVAGYYYNSSTGELQLNDKETNPLSMITLEKDNITIQDLKALKQNSPHKEIHDELTTFDKTKLKKTRSKENLAKLTEEQEMIENLRQKIINRRHSISDMYLDIPVIEDL